MLKILNAHQLKQADAYTIANEPISSLALMERASHSFVSWFVKRYESSLSIAVVCGTGNNGGDGLAIARLLVEYNYKISVLVVVGHAKYSDDFILNRKRLQEKISIGEIKDRVEENYFDQFDVIIDALIGTGLTRPVDGLYQQVIQEINKTKAIRISVDVPSGMFIDKPSIGDCIRAHHTITFQMPKLAFLLPSNGEFVGNWHIVKIGLNKKFISDVDAVFFLLEKKDVRALLIPRKKFDHKGSYGKALLIAGSYGKMGAAVLSAKAALRSGLGLLVTHVPACGYQIMQISVPESMVSTDSNEHYVSHIPDLASFSSIGLGPGIGQTNETRKVLQQVLSSSTSPLVLDADALNLLATDRNLLNILPENSILTPHPGEFARLVGNWENDFERLNLQRSFSKQHKCIVVLKGAHTSISTPEGNVFFNTTGNPGMATAGSGDVLLGIISGLLAQNYAPSLAALIGVYLHGMSGDFAAQVLSKQALIASDIIDFIPYAYKELQ